MVRIQLGNQKSDGRVGGWNPGVGSSFLNLLLQDTKRWFAFIKANKNVQANNIKEKQLHKRNETVWIFEIILCRRKTLLE